MISRVSLTDVRSLSSAFSAFSNIRVFSEVPQTTELNQIRVPSTTHALHPENTAPFVGDAGHTSTATATLPASSASPAPHRPASSTPTMLQHTPAHGRPPPHGRPFISRRPLVSVISVLMRGGRARLAQRWVQAQPPRGDGERLTHPWSSSCSPLGPRCVGAPGGWAAGVLVPASSVSAGPSVTPGTSVGHKGQWCQGGSVGAGAVGLPRGEAGLWDTVPQGGCPWVGRAALLSRPGWPRGDQAGSQITPKTPLSSAWGCAPYCIGAPRQEMWSLLTNDEEGGPEPAAKNSPRKLYQEPPWLCPRRGGTKACPTLTVHKRGRKIP